MTIECRAAPHGRDIVSTQGENKYVIGRIVRDGHDCRVTIGTFNRVYDGMGQAEEKAMAAAETRIEKAARLARELGPAPKMEDKPKKVGADG